MHKIQINAWNPNKELTILSSKIILLSLMFSNNGHDYRLCKILALCSDRWRRVRSKISVLPEREWMATLEELFIFHEHVS